MCSKSNNYMHNGHPAPNYYSKNCHCYYSKVWFFFLKLTTYLFVPPLPNTKLKNLDKPGFYNLQFHKIH
jgi:hypothetical protein